MNEVAPGAEIPCVGAVVHDETGRLLLVRRRNPPGAGLWSVPGGRVEAGEDDVRAVAREVAEETGLRVRVGPLLGAVRRDAPTGGVYVIRDYLCTVDGATDPHPADDATDAQWVDAAGLEALTVVDGLRQALTAWDALPRV